MQKCSFSAESERDWENLDVGYYNDRLTAFDPGQPG